MPDLKLVLDGIKDFIDEKFQRIQMCSIRKAQSGLSEGPGSALSLECRLPPTLILGMSGGFMLRLRLSFAIFGLCGVVEGSLHYLLQLDVRLRSGENLAHPSDIVLQKVFV